MLQPVTDVRDVNQTSLVQVMADDVVPRRASGVEPLAAVAGDDAVARRLVRMLGQDVCVEVGGVVLQRPGRHRRAAVAGRMATVD